MRSIAQTNQRQSLSIAVSFPPHTLQVNLPGDFSPAFGLYSKISQNNKHSHDQNRDFFIFRHSFAKSGIIPQIGRQIQAQARFFSQIPPCYSSTLPLFCRFKPHRSPKRPFQVQTAIRIRLCLNRAGNRLKMPPSPKIHALIPSQSIKTAAKRTKSKKYSRRNDRIPIVLRPSRRPAKSASGPLGRPEQVLISIVKRNKYVLYRKLLTFGGCGGQSGET